MRLVTDNASNNIKAFGTLIVPGFEAYFEDSSDDLIDASGEEQPQEENVAHGGTNDNEIITWCDILHGSEELLRLPCFLHTLQLVVFDGFKESSHVKTAMAKVSSIAKFR